MMPHKELLRATLFTCTLVTSYLTSTTGIAGEPVLLTLGTQGSQLLFDHATLSVKAGEKIKLTFSNNAAFGSSMDHNWVLTQPGKDREVAAAAVSAGLAKSYVPDSPDILAHTPLVKPGKTATVEFQVPAKPGSYPYLCTLPGHYPSLKGVLEVK